ncbi:putative Dimethylmenaquinone methyltransferase [Vibrio nigripulchritudo SFn27]|uniref:Putative 4-hydroxy-4-methyl-2-oxoglutarate aldolase n=1 Tax=Vibrio nigripulchritudo TaxID=28173 RepID=U4KI87_9VIBR|nr:RraA family protein [Vibrio nigripulchritudo]CCN35051.1 putative Dimethylmenaquinone methyltransferase [Vibrio nigripulchritudo AM115]CCN40740.1 putative Dimethylmenaquinone methyltransferase [Vibrio nigripulchritudo FTn2]CCN64451.1 putative Dimethylmenaquinone methyltransferase [Vibrio nigripulchritudo POn4]CCN77440.1 putative Dimethylmenaquinone methyltransferase [Vibrio nigripulchritudo SO65]CCN82447.1 putative Dimethylmenaquinone methyltransferase [Vibrio nigripulchritudo BLFn1]
MEYEKKVILPRPDVDQDLIKKCQAMTSVLSATAVFSDAQNRDGVMDHEIKQRSVNKPFIGTALTVKLKPGDIVDCLPIFDIAQPGDVVVIDANGTPNTSIWGGLMAGLAVAAGVVGTVIDGSARDTDEARMLDYPVSSRSVSPRAAHSAYTGRTEPIEINVPITCGGQIVHPGDLVVCDELGVTVVPSQNLPEVYLEAKKLASNEEKVRKEILAGATVEELLAKFGRI